MLFFSIIQLSHPQSETSEVSFGLLSKLAVVQNKCLRAVAGAFRAIPVPVLEAKSHVAPIAICLNELQAKARFRMRSSGQVKLTTQKCRKIASNLRGRPRAHRPTPGEVKKAWEKGLGIVEPPTPPPPFPPPWEPPPPGHAALAAAASLARKKRQAELKRKHKEDWDTAWMRYQAQVPHPSPAQSGPLGKKRLRIHAGLKKAESSLVTQVRSEKIGLAAFLHGRKVPGFDSPACPCGWAGRQTAKHVIMHCPLHAGRRDMLAKTGMSDYRRIVESPKALKVVVRWMMHLGVLGQFSLAEEQLFGDSIETIPSAL